MKTTYKAKGVTAVRKHLWLPCVLSAQIDKKGTTKKEMVEILRRCYFMDLFTEGEWRAMTGMDVKGKAVHKARLKKKVAGWLMAMNRMAKVNVQWYGEACRFAMKEYEDLLREPLQWGVMPGSAFFDEKGR